MVVGSCVRYCGRIASGVDRGARFREVSVNTAVYLFGWGTAIYVLGWIALSWLTCGLLTFVLLALTNGKYGIQISLTSSEDWIFGFPFCLFLGPIGLFLMFKPARR